MRALILIVLVTVPLIITPGLLAYFDITPKLAVLYLGLSLLLLFHARNLANARALVATRACRLFVGLMLVAWLSAALSTALAGDRTLAVFGSNWRRLGLISYTAILLFAFLTAAWAAAERRNLILLLRAIAIAGMLAGGYGIAQYFRFDPLLPVSSYLAGQGPSTIVRPPGTLGHADYFAAWLTMVVFASLALARIDENAWARRAGVTAAVVGMVAIVLSGTRGALLGTAAGCGYLLFRIRPVPTRRSIALAAGIACLCIAFVLSPSGMLLRSRFRWSIADLKGGARLILWRDSARLGLERPLFGFGPDTFVAEFPRAQSLELAQAYPDFYHESPHNALVDEFVGQGALGVAVFAGLVLLGMYAAQRSSSPAAAPLGGGLIAAFVAHQFIVFVGATALYFFVVVAMLVALIRDIPAPLRSRLGPTDPLPSRDREGAGLPWLTPVEVTLAVALAFTASRILAFDHAFASAMRFASSGQVREAAAEYRRALAWQLPGHGADLAYSRTVASLATALPPGDTRAAALSEAIQSGRRAVNTSDDSHNAWYHLATLLAQEDDAAGVERCLRQAIAVAPEWFKPHWALARVLELSGRSREALAEAADAVSKDGGKDQEVVETWRRIRRQSP
jgi:O-antigen ligase